MLFTCMEENIKKDGKGVVEELLVQEKLYWSTLVCENTNLTYYN